MHLKSQRKELETFLQPQLELRAAPRHSCQASPMGNAEPQARPTELEAAFSKVPARFLWGYVPLSTLNQWVSPWLLIGVTRCLDPTPESLISGWRSVLGIRPFKNSPGGSHMHAGEDHCSESVSQSWHHHRHSEPDNPWSQAVLCPEGCLASVASTH